MIESQLHELAKLINEAKITVFYGGAGTSTESGIPDYRGRFGRWTELEKQDIKPQEFASIKRLLADPAAFFKRGNEEDVPQPEPNMTHKVLANIERHGKDIRVITQNVDNLHYRAGQLYVDELHGNSRDWYCMDCRRVYPVGKAPVDADNVPRCVACQGIVRPSVVLFGEAIPRATLDRARWSLEQADLLIIAGTSLTTPTARRLIHSFTGKHVVVLNHDPLDISPLKADLYFQEPIAELMMQLAPLLDDYHEE